MLNFSGVDCRRHPNLLFSWTRFWDNPCLVKVEKNFHYHPTLALSRWGKSFFSHQDQLLKAKCLSVTTSSTTTVTRMPSSQGAECYKSRNVEDTNTKYKIQIHKMLKLGRYKRIMISVQSTRSPASLLALSSFLCLATWPTYRSFEKPNPFQSHERLAM